MSCKNQVWLLVALGIAVVLFAAALVIRFRRKSANEQHQPDPNAIEAPPHGATDQVRKN